MADMNQIKHVKPIHVHFESLTSCIKLFSETTGPKLTKLGLNRYCRI